MESAFIDVFPGPPAYEDQMAVLQPHAGLRAQGWPFRPAPAAGGCAPVDLYDIDIAEYARACTVNILSYLSAQPGDIFKLVVGRVDARLVHEPQRDAASPALQRFLKFRSIAARFSGLMGLSLLPFTAMRAVPCPASSARLAGQLWSTAFEPLRLPLSFCFAVFVEVKQPSADLIPRMACPHRSRGRRSRSCPSRT